MVLLSTMKDRQYREKINWMVETGSVHLHPISFNVDSLLQIFQAPTNAWCLPNILSFFHQVFVGQYVADVALLNNLFGPTAVLGSNVTDVNNVGTSTC